MLGLFLLVIFGFICMYLGYMLAIKAVQSHYDSDPDGLIGLLNGIKKTKNEPQTLNHMFIVSETHDGLVFLYREDTGEYISKGETIIEAIRNAALRFENFEFTLRA